MTETSSTKISMIIIEMPATFFCMFVLENKVQTNEKCQDDILHVKTSPYAKICQFLNNFYILTKMITYALVPVGPSVGEEI